MSSSKQRKPVLRLNTPNSFPTNFEATDQSQVSRTFNFNQPNIQTVDTLEKNLFHKKITKAAENHNEIFGKFGEIAHQTSTCLHELLKSAPKQLEAQVPKVELSLKELPPPTLLPKPAYFIRPVTLKGFKTQENRIPFKILALRLFLTQLKNFLSSHKIIKEYLETQNLNDESKNHEQKRKKASEDQFQNKKLKTEWRDIPINSDIMSEIETISDLKPDDYQEQLIADEFNIILKAQFYELSKKEVSVFHLFRNSHLWEISYLNTEREEEQEEVYTFENEHFASFSSEVISKYCKKIFVTLDLRLSSVLDSLITQILQGFTVEDSNIWFSACNKVIFAHNELEPSMKTNQETISLAEHREKIQMMEQYHKARENVLYSSINNILQILVQRQAAEKNLLEFIRSQQELMFELKENFPKISKTTISTSKVEDLHLQILDLQSKLSEVSKDVKSILKSPSQLPILENFTQNQTDFVPFHANSIPKSHSISDFTSLAEFTEIPIPFHEKSELEQNGNNDPLAVQSSIFTSAPSPSAEWHNSLFSNTTEDSHWS
jgi:hypothetical protein